MIKNIFFILFLFQCASYSIAQPVPKASVKNVSIANLGTSVKITYDLDSKNQNDKYIVKLFIYKNSDALLSAKSATGDIGNGITSGTGKIINWTPATDDITINSDVLAEIRATPIVVIPAGTHLLKSALFPGLGNYRLGNGESYALYGVAAYGSITASIWLNQKAIDSYTTYKNSFDIAKSNELYKNSVQQKNLSIACAGLATAIWAVNLYSVLHKTSKLKKNNYTVTDSRYYYNLGQSFVSGKSHVTKIDTRNDYQIAMDNGDAYFSSNAFLSFPIKEYEKALIEYNKALTFKPNDNSAFQKVKITQTIIDNIKLREIRFARNKTIADSFFNAKKIEKSIIFYDSLLPISGKSYCSDYYWIAMKMKKNAKDSIIYYKDEENYNTSIAKAEAHLKNKAYDSAIVYIKNASELRQMRPYPATLIKKVEQGKIDDEYNRYIAEADAYLKNKDYTNAKTCYEKALNIKSKEKYPQTQIDYIVKQLALIKQQQTNKDYAAAIQKGNALYYQGRYESAKSYFGDAHLLKKDEAYPMTMIDNCNTYIAAADKAKLDQDYLTAINSGDAAYNNKEYSKAKEYYQEASKLKSTEIYPKNKITEINKILDVATNDLPALYKKFKDAVFFVLTSGYTDKYQGSGFFVSSSGICVSNYHVFKGTYQGLAKIITEDGAEYKVDKVLEKSETNDYIIFTIKNPYSKIFPCVKIASKESEIGEKVFAIGNPEGFEKTLSDGIVSSYRDDKNYIQTTTPVTHGSSGGPLFNMKGEVIGITTMGKSEGNLNFAVNIKLLKLSNYK